MGIDARYLFRPRSRMALREVVAQGELDADVLDDGALVLPMFERFERLRADPDEVRERLPKGLAAAHDDARGLLVFPEVCAVRGASYAEAVAEVERAGFWVVARELSDEERAARAAAEQARLDPMLALLERRDRGEDVDQLVMELLSGRPRKAPEPTPTPARLEDTTALLQGIEEALAAGAAMGTVAILVRRPTRAPLPLDRLGLHDVNGVNTLADGTYVIETATVGDPEAVVVRMTMKAELWRDEHGEPRGVATFGSDALRKLAFARSYEEALETLGDVVRFVPARTFEEHRAWHRERLRRLIEG